MASKFFITSPAIVCKNQWPVVRCHRPDSRKRDYTYYIALAMSNKKDRKRQGPIGALSREEKMKL
jgi:hypothetical protein